jgi:squalene-hopene/tetraprenyl-beta-curcumene cyclase
VCISCHTSLPYVLARGELHRVLGEPSLADPQRKLLDMVKVRVGLWPQLLPWYGGEQKLLSRGTETVMNALILSHEDARQGKLSPLTLKALNDMWAQQRTEGPQAGSWPWIQFGNEPWEAPDSSYYGATLAALAVGFTPDSYREEPTVQTGVALLRDYLRREYPRQTLVNRINLLWASTAMPDLIEPTERATLLAELSAQQRADGGWSLASLMPRWTRHDGSLVPDTSDGYATGLITFVLQEAGIAAGDPRLIRGLAWLEGHQSRWNGRWMAQSPNRAKRWIPAEGDHFMDDAATAFAVLALTRAQTGNIAARADAPRPMR